MGRDWVSKGKRDGNGGIGRMTILCGKEKKESRTQKERSGTWAFFLVQEPDQAEKTVWSEEMGLEILGLPRSRSTSWGQRGCVGSVPRILEGGSELAAVGYAGC
jgi:hypothetical protein